MAGHRNSYGKRSQGEYGDHEGSKRRNPGDDRDTYAPGPEDTVYRYLCPGRKIGSIIGRGGDIVKQLRADTHSKIKITDPIPGCDERVITIFSTRAETNSIDDYGDVCPAQDALFRVHDKLVSDEAMDEDIDAGNHQVTARLLVPSDQIGCVIGKGGQIIQGIRTETGATIRILKNENLPACASSSDELLQITGEAPIVKKALAALSSRLHENPSRTQHLLQSTMPNKYAPSGQYGDFNSGAPVIGIGSLMGSYGSYNRELGPLYPQGESSAKDFTLRLICPSSNIGGVIGKAGSIIKQIRQESGAYIKVDSSSTEDDCIITISAKEYFEDPISPTIDAAVRLQPRCSERIEEDSVDSPLTTRLLVPKSKIGCLIGKGGSIISEMRRSTRANIRIHSKENLPKVASDDDEMVEINGDPDIARNALIQVTTRLKANFFEKENALSAFPPPSVPYRSNPIDDMRYESRDSKSHSRGYSSYSGGYGGPPDVLPSESYGRYDSQGGNSNYGLYGDYTGHSGSAGLSGPNPGSHGKRHGY